ncbi:MAG: NAD(P)/FAD-dependent oxidoreductase [Nocardioidaceae bacterium]|nr:NAD(P)/FAD-dependent oxidoreductase [Nocardioidaceae bacterium]
MTEHADVVVVGGGHNALVAATYLARAGLRTVVLERLDTTGGAAVSVEPWAGVPARLSRYSYLVSLMPEALCADLGLDLDLRSRPTASFSPTLRDGVADGLLVESTPGAATAESFLRLTGDESAYTSWERFYDEVAGLAEVVAPTFLQPLPRASRLREDAETATWDAIVEQPLGHTIEERFHDDLVRGVVATDALIGTFASLNDPSLIQNRCFLYHLAGNGTGEWRVPVGGMGAVTGELARAATHAGAQLRTGCTVTSIRSDDDGAQVVFAGPDGETTIDCDWVLCGAAPAVLDELVGREVRTKPSGAQLKINLLVDRLPQLASGMDPETAFAGTLHLGESYSELETAHAEAAGGSVPTRMPGETYCHTLTDPSILGPDLAASGAHTLTYFGLHTPSELFADDPEGQTILAVDRAIAEMDQHLAEPLASVLAHDPDGRPCIEAKNPLDIEAALNMPGGHIFHGDLAWPWLSGSEEAVTPAERWGVATAHPRVLMCGSGARRGGAVSGIAGHNAAHAVLDFIQP